jgi:hypothetical protein
MPRENDLEGVQDQGGKDGGQKGMPKPERAALSLRPACWLLAQLSFAAHGVMPKPMQQ